MGDMLGPSQDGQAHCTDHIVSHMDGHTRHPEKGAAALEGWGAQARIPKRMRAGERPRVDGRDLAGSGTTLRSRYAAPAECGREAGLEWRWAVRYCTDERTEAPGRRDPQGLRKHRPARNWSSVPHPALLPPLWWPLHPLGSRITLSKVEALFTSLENRAELGPERVWQASFLGFSDGSNWKESTCNVGDTGDGIGSLGQKDPLEEEMATHSSILAWEIPWTEEPGGLPSMGSQSQTRLSIQTHIYTQASFLEWRLMKEVREAWAQGSFYQVPEPGPRLTPTPASLLLSHGCHSS